MSYGTVQAEKLTTESGYSLGAGNASSFKNRIINGEMDIDQRNAGASVTPTTDESYQIDRWISRLSLSSRFSVQRNAGSVTPPVGFTNYLGVTSLAATSVGTNDYFAIAQYIEGFNVADLGFGTANAKSVTVSFWVRSSLTGTFGVTILNGAEGRAYPATYTISSANTWEYETVTIPGDVTGTWATGNTSGLKLFFSLGAGATYSRTAGSWGAGAYSPTGATQVVATNGATFYVTGVQLEVGTVATSWDFRSYGTELALCQRYYERGTVGVAFSYTPSAFGNGKWIEVPVNFNVNKRATPTIAYGTVSQNTNFSPSVLNTNIMINADIIGTQSFSVAPGGSATPPSSGTYWYGTIPWTASIEL